MRQFKSCSHTFVESKSCLTYGFIEQFEAFWSISRWNLGSRQGVYMEEWKLFLIITQQLLLNLCSTCQFYKSQWSRQDASSSRSKRDWRFGGSSFNLTSCSAAWLLQPSSIVKPNQKNQGWNPKKISKGAPFSKHWACQKHKTCLNTSFGAASTPWNNSTVRTESSFVFCMSEKLNGNSSNSSSSSCSLSSSWFSSTLESVSHECVFLSFSMILRLAYERLRNSAGWTSAVETFGIFSRNKASASRIVGSWSSVSEPASAINKGMLPEARLFAIASNAPSIPLKAFRTYCSAI